MSDTALKIADALLAANVEYKGMSWNGFNLFGDPESIDELIRMQNEAANAKHFRDEVQRLRAQVTWPEGSRPVRFDDLAKIMSLLPPPPLKQDGYVHRFEGPNPHDTIYAIREAFMLMLDAKPDALRPSLKTAE